MPKLTYQSVDRRLILPTTTQQLFQLDECGLSRYIEHVPGAIHYPAANIIGSWENLQRLRLMLNPNQGHIFDAYGVVDLVGSLNGNYRIIKRMDYNVYSFNESVFLCYNVDDTDDVYLNMIAQALLIHTNEQVFLNKANRSAGRIYEPTT